MRFSGQIHKDGKFWLAEIPILDLMTQGRTKKEAYEMIVDMLESLINKEEFRATLFKGKDNKFEIGSLESKHMISLLLQRKREISGLSLSEVANRLGASSHNPYDTYEKGNSAPSIDELNELLHAVCPETDIVINESAFS